MSRVAKGPDGRAFNFPDDASDDEISQAINGIYGPPLPAPEKPTQGEKFAMGMGDPVAGTAQIVSRFGMMLPPDAVPGLAGLDTSERTRAAGQDAIDKMVSDREAQWQARRAASGDTGAEITRALGSGVATAPIAALAPTTFVGQMAAGAGLNMLNPVTDTSKGFAREKLSQGLWGAGTGGASELVGSGIGKVISPKPPSDDVQKLIDAGVKPTFGQRLGGAVARTEEKLSSWPFVGDLIKNSQRLATESFNKSAINKAVEPIGGAVDEIGHNGIRKAGDILSNAYDELVPNLQLIPDRQLQNDLISATSLTTNMSDSAAKQFDKIMNNELPRGPLTGDGLKSVIEKLGKLSSQFGKSQDPSHQMMGEAFAEVRTAMMQNLQRNNPQFAERLSNIDKGWAWLVRLERAANSNTKEGVFTAENLMQSMKALDDSVRKRATARGTALMQEELVGPGARVLGATYPDSGSPGRLLAAGAGLGLLGPKAVGAGALASVPYLPGLRNTGLANSRGALSGPAAAALNKFGVPIATSGLIFGGRPH